MRRTLLFALAFFALLPASPSLAQKKKEAPKDLPKVLMALPLGVAPGTKTRVTLRGLRLEGATAVRCQPKGTAKIVAKNKVAVPNQQDANRVGNSVVEVELDVPADVAGATLNVVVQAGGKESVPHAVLLDRSPVLMEKEPNNGFREAQMIEIGKVVQGSIGSPLDVDTFRFEGKVGQQLVLEVMAARHGSALDSVLTLYDDKGQKLAENDDTADSTDSRLEIVLPRTGTYYAAIQDAHDQGGATHVYRFVVRPK